MKEIKQNTFLWIALLILIGLNYLFADKNVSAAIYLIVGVSTIKFLGVVFQFIETKHAHIVWKLLGIVFVLIYAVGILFGYN